MIEFTYPRESPYLGSFFFFFGYTVIQFCNWESLPLCRIPKYIEKHNAPRVWIVTARESTVKHRGGTRHESRTNGGFRNVRARTRPRHGNCWPGYWAPLTLLDSVHSNKPSGQSIARSKIVFVTGDGHASLLLPTLRGRLRSKRIHFARRREGGRQRTMKRRMERKGRRLVLPDGLTVLREIRGYDPCAPRKFASKKSVLPLTRVRSAAA